MLVLFVTILLILVSSWNYSIMRKLKIAEKTHKTADDFLMACQVSTQAVKVGQISSGFILIMGLTLMVYNSLKICCF